MVKRTYATPAVPAASATGVAVTVPFGNVPAAATVHVVPSGDVSTRYPPVDAVGSSPQVADGLITSWEMLTVPERRSTIWSPVAATFEPQPPTWDWSISMAGPQSGV